MYGHATGGMQTRDTKKMPSKTHAGTRFKKAFFDFT